LPEAYVSNPPNQTKDKAFDNSSPTKWLDFTPGTSCSGWIQYQYAGMAHRDDIQSFVDVIDADEKRI